MVGIVSNKPRGEAGKNKTCILWLLSVPGAGPIDASTVTSCSATPNILRRSSKESNLLKPYWITSQRTCKAKSFQDASGARVGFL